MKYRIRFKINVLHPDHILRKMIDDGVSVISIENKVRDKLGEKDLSYESEAGYGLIRAANMDRALDVLSFLASLIEVDPSSELQVDNICVPIVGQARMSLLDETESEMYHYPDILTETLRSTARVCRVPLTVDEIEAMPCQVKEKLAEMMFILRSE